MDKLKKNFFYNICYQLLLIILPFLTAPYIARVIGKDGSGVYAYSSAIVSYFCLFILLGLNNYGVKIVAEKANGRNEELVGTFWNIYGFQLLMGVLVVICYFFYVFWKVNTDAEVYYMQIVTVLASAIDVTWYYFGLEKFKLTTATNTVFKVLAAVMVFALVKTKDDLLVYVGIIAVSIFMPQVILWWNAVRKLGIRKPDVNGIKKHIIPNLTLFIPVLAVSLYKIMDKIMLGGLTSTSQVAIYEYSEKIINIPLSLVNAFSLAMLPFVAGGTLNVASKNAYLKKSLVCSAFASVPMALGIAAIAPEFAVIFYGEQFAECGMVIQLLSVTIITISWETVLKTQFFIPENHNRRYIIGAVTGAVVNMGTNMLLIPHLQVLGAALGTILAEVSVVVVLTGYLITYVKLNDILGDCVVYLLSGVIMFLVVREAATVLPHGVAGLVLEILTGVAVYIACMGIYFVKKRRWSKRV